MSDEYAMAQVKPGDTILITYRESSSLGKKFLVIECPEEYQHYVGNYAWVNLAHGPAAFMTNEYSVVSSEKSGRESVDESLKKQLDDNLKHAFGF